MSLNVWVNAVIKTLVLPPGSILLLMALGFVLVWRWRRTGMTLIALAALALLVLSLPMTADATIGTLLRHRPLDPAAAADGQAIVILGGGVVRNAPEYGEDTPTTSSLVRCRYGAKLHRETGLPILVSGGNPLGATLSDAEAMRRYLVNELGTPVRWVETASRNTEENALQSLRALAPDGISRVILVTHALHMPRAEAAFRRAGFEVIPAPTAFPIVDQFRLTDLLPGAGALRRNAFVIKEWIGALWLSLRARTEG
ncbi:MAG: YdcF family protein [Kiloniellales bacterium]